MSDRKEKFKWGILGCGRIANDFADCLALIPEAEIAAVASRSEDKIRAFRDKHNPARSYSDYSQLARDPELDAIYVATTHNFHKDHVLLCLENGKNVLCEKPLTTNAAEAKLLIEEARKRKIFLMEAMWTRFLPLWVQVKKWLEEGLIGDIVLVKADFGFFTRHGDFGRHLNPDLAGGALLDVGIYPVSLACWLFGGMPVHSTSDAYITDHGVDGVSMYYLNFGKGRSALLSSSVIVHTPKDAVIVGTKGYLRIPEFWKGSEVNIYINGKEPETHEFPYEAFGFQFEAIEVMNCIQNHLTESPVMPLQETLDIMSLMDSFRDQWDLHYPWEK